MSLMLKLRLLTGVPQSAVQDEVSVTLDTNMLTKARIVQSPERMKRIIATMAENVIEERRNIAANEAKARVLKSKLDILAVSEQVGYSYLIFHNTKENKYYEPGCSIEYQTSNCISF
jgi:hypothetical protein